MIQKKFFSNHWPDHDQSKVVEEGDWRRRQLRAKVGPVIIDRLARGGELGWLVKTGWQMHKLKRRAACNWKGLPWQI
jgi:hypothetical protein